MESAESPKPIRLVPHHMSSEEGKRTELKDEISEIRGEMLPNETPSTFFARTAESALPTLQEYKEAREAEISIAPDLDSLIRDKFKERGNEENLKPNKNYGLQYIEWYRNRVKTAQDLRKIVKHSEDPNEVSKAAIQFKAIKDDLDQDMELLGPSFEKDYREYIRKRLDYIHFKTALSNWGELEEELSKPDYSSMPEDKDLDTKARSRIEKLSRGDTSKTLSDDSPYNLLINEFNEAVEALKYIYPEGSEAYKDKVNELSDQLFQNKFEIYYERQQKNANEALPGEYIMKIEKNKDGSYTEQLVKKPFPRSKAEIKKELEIEKQKAEELWTDPMVQYFWKQAKWAELLKDFSEGKDVLETQSVIKYLNTLHDWENSHQRTTIGGVLVGPPGIGKTTIIRHYLELKNRKSAYIDLSEDVTRYMLYGSKSIEFTSQIDYFKALEKSLKDLDTEGFARFVTENAATVQKVFGGSESESVAILISQINDELKRGEEITGDNNFSSLRNKVENLANKAFRKELGNEFSHIVKKNGWKDGIIIAALRRGESVILDEFNKTSNWSLVYSLMTAKPGEKWYFADNDEWIDIPKDWRMYFTANIGKRHGVKAVPEALASRAGGKVMEVDFPPLKEFMDVALASIADAEGNVLISKEEIAKLYYTIHDVFPEIRKFSENEQYDIPISFRTIRDLGEKLILTRDPKTRKNVYRRTDTSFDKALFEVLINTYKLYEKPKAPAAIVAAGLSKGLFLDPSIKSEVLKYVSEDSYNKAYDQFNNPETKEDYMDVFKKISGLPDAPQSAGLVMANTIHF